MKNILITGGAGFIGSHLCDALVKNDRVLCIDNLITGNLKNIQHLFPHPNFIFIRHDISQPLSFSLKQPLNPQAIFFHLPYKIDYLLNLACPASPVDYQNFPLETLLVSSYGTKNMLDLALAHKARFVQASTSEVYGNPQEHPQKETYWGNVNPIGLRSSYDEGKRFSESLIMTYQRKYGLDVGIIRIFNTYGERMRPDDGRVISNFIVQALKNEDLTVYGDGSQTRSFCYISDMIEGIIKMMKSSGQGPVNLGNPDEFTILDLALKIIKLTGTKSQIVYKELREDDPKQRRPDITLAREKLNWNPKVSLDEGLSKTIKWFRENL